MRLLDLPPHKNIKLKLPVSRDGENFTEEICTFHKIDGMYSLCTVDSFPENENSVHLSAVVRLEKKGEYYVISADQSKDDTDIPTREEKSSLTR